MATGKIQPKSRTKKHRTKKKKPSRSSRLKDAHTVYTEYLASDKWRALRLKVFERDKFTCSICQEKKPPHRLNAHHEHYRNLYDEDLSDLTTICRICHAALHKEIRKKQKKKHKWVRWKW